MITRITLENAEAYRVLFNKAVEVLSTHDVNGKLESQPVLTDKDFYKVVNIIEEEFLPGTHYIFIDGEYVLTDEDAIYDPTAIYAIETKEVITTLEEYFSYIKNLVLADKAFSVLPLDEEYFEIDANTREIKVPAAFRANGIAIQGDEVAEILYFKINRFFDMTDLAEQEVYIQWKIGDKKGISAPWIVDKNIEPGFVIIGWPISSDITAAAGKVDFSVRFFSFNKDIGSKYEDTLEYSFSTSTASVNIKEGLNYDIKEMEIDSLYSSNDLILNRLQNSVINNENGVDALEPEFLSGDTVTTGDINLISSETQPHKYNVYLTNTTNGENKPATFETQAIVKDTGSIEYNWIKRNLDGDIINYNAGEVIFKKANDENQIANKTYYYKNGEFYPPYNFTEENTFADALEKGLLYERVTVLELNQEDNMPLGSYQAYAQNRLGQNIKKAYGPIIYLNGPIAPSFNENGNLGLNGILIDNEYSLAVDVNTDIHAYTTYEYFKKSFEENAAFEVYPNGAVAKEEGYYKVKVASKLNGHTEFTESNEIRITHPASTLVVEIPESGRPDSSYVAGQNIAIKVTEPESENRTKDDKVICKVYKYGSDITAEQFNIDFENAVNGIYKVKEGIDIFKEEFEIENFEGIFTIENTNLNETGIYFCIIVNEYNGSTAESSSRFIEIVDNVLE